MPSGKFVAYYRVSTQRQGRSGLGLDAQRSAVRGFLNGGDWSLIAELTEVESGKVNDRRELQHALAACRVHGATLLIAKLDRLSRDAHFLLGLDKAGVEFLAVDMPNANRLTVGIMALVAQQEREAISQRTKAALAAARARGVTLGNPANLSNREEGTRRSSRARKEIATARARDLAPILLSLQGAGFVALRTIAEELNCRAVPAARGGAWSASQVSRVLAEISKLGTERG